LASLLGTTYGLPAVAFESPGERLASTRLDIPIPPEMATTGDYSLAPVTHVYHTADPIPQGKCTGRGSPCAQGGYALETKCHLGASIVYDTVGRLNWSVDIRTHPIREIITRVLEKDILWEFGRRVPRARAEDDCTVSRNTVMLGEDVYVFLVVRTVPNGSLVIISLHPRVFRSVT
jgi:lipase ATG15